MNASGLIVIAVTAATLTVPTSNGVTGADNGGQGGGQTLVELVRDATAKFRNVEDALAAGYTPNQGCVSGPQEGAMGLHLAKGILFDDVLDPSMPEVLVYEPRQGRMYLVAAEYVTPADAWRASHPNDPPNLAGHLLHFTPGPNRYGSEAFYELHVWAWRINPNGPFADWNPRVSCADHVAHD